MRAPIPPRPHPDPSRADEPGPAGDTEDVGLPAQVSDELVAAGLAVGEPMGRDRSGRLAPRRALDPDGRDVVVQIVDLSEKAAGARTLRRLADLRSLRNDAIAPVRQVLALPGDRVGVVSDLIAGADLAVVLGARGGLTRSEAARLLDDLGGALAHMHERGMAHGDVAAANVIVSTDGRPVLIDLLGGVLETGTPAMSIPWPLSCVSARRAPRPWPSGWNEYFPTPWIPIPPAGPARAIWRPVLPRSACRGLSSCPTGPGWRRGPCGPRALSRRALWPPGAAGPAIAGQFGAGAGGARHFPVVAEPA